MYWSSRRNLRAAARHIEPAQQQLRLIGGYTQLVAGRIEGREGIDIRPETDAALLEEIDQRVLLEMRRPIERHVLGQMGKPALIVVLVQRLRALTTSIR